MATHVRGRVDEIFDLCPMTEVKNLVNSSTHVGSHSRVRESSSSRSGQDCAYFCHIMGFDNLTKFCSRSPPRQSSLYLHPHITPTGVPPRCLRMSSFRTYGTPGR